MKIPSPAFFITASSLLTLAPASMTLAQNDNSGDERPTLSYEQLVEVFENRGVSADVNPTVRITSPLADDLVAPGGGGSGANFVLNLEGSLLLEGKTQVTVTTRVTDNAGRTSGTTTNLSVSPTVSGQSLTPAP